jgi:hypothetical protein
MMSLQPTSLMMVAQTPNGACPPRLLFIFRLKILIRLTISLELWDPWYYVYRLVLGNECFVPGEVALP